MNPSSLESSLSSNFPQPISSPNFINKSNEIDDTSTVYSNFAKVNFLNAICQYDPMLAPIQPNFQIKGPELRVFDPELKQLFEDAESRGLTLNPCFESSGMNQALVTSEQHFTSLFSNNNPYNVENSKINEEKEEKDEKKAKREYKVISKAHFEEYKSSRLQWRSKSPKLVNNTVDTQSHIHPVGKGKEQNKKTTHVTVKMAKKISIHHSKNLIKPYIPLRHFPANFAHSILGQSILKIMPEIRKRILDYRAKPQNVVRGIYVLSSSRENSHISSSYKACSNPLHPYYRELEANKLKYANVLEAIKVYRPTQDILIRSPNEVFYYIKEVLQHRISHYVYKPNVGWIQV